MIIIRIGFVGAGKVGWSLGKYLKINNFNVIGYFSRNVDSAEGAAKFTETKVFYSLENLASKCDILFLTTTDTEILSVWENLKELSIKNKIICHCSGSLSSEIFKEREDYNICGYSVHPLFPISNKRESYKYLKNAFITIEGDKEYLEKIKNIFILLGNKVKIIKVEDKVLYHESAVLVSNLVLSIVNIAVDNLEKCGFTREEGLSSLYPLIKNNIENLGVRGIEESLTGPVERGDLETVKKHMTKISGNEKEIYRLLSIEALEIGKKKNTFKNYKDMEDFLWEI